MGYCKVPDICWIYNTADREQSQRFLECVGDHFLTQLVRQPARASKILLFVHREGLVGDVKAGGRLGQRDREMLDFSILAEPQRGVSRTATLDFQTANLNLLRTMVERVPGEVILEAEGAMKASQYFQDVILQVQYLPIPPQ